MVSSSVSVIISVRGDEWTSVNSYLGLLILIILFKHFGDVVFEN